MTMFLGLPLGIAIGARHALEPDHLAAVSTLVAERPGWRRGALLGAANKMKYWDLYVEFYQALNQRNEQGLPPVFAEELARTYAEKAAQKRK